MRPVQFTAQDVIANLRYERFNLADNLIALLFCNILSQTSSATVVNMKDNAKDHQAAAPITSESIVLLVDQYLMQLPLEALQLLQMEHVTSVSREISLQMMFNKMYPGSSAGNAIRHIHNFSKTRQPLQRHLCWP